MLSSLLSCPVVFAAFSNSLNFDCDVRADSRQDFSFVGKVSFRAIDVTS